MMIVPAGVKVHLAFAFRGRNASRVKLLFWDGNGLCLFTAYVNLSTSR